MQSFVVRLTRTERAFFSPFARLSAYTVMPLVVIIGLGILLAALRVNSFGKFNVTLPLLGNEITLNSIVDMQWFLFAISVMLAAAPTWSQGPHVRVDFVYEHMRPRWKAIVNLAGHLIFALPFIYFMIPATWRFALASYNRNEGSAQGGLTDFFLVKMFMPFGFVLLAIFLVVDIVRQATWVFGPPPDKQGGR
jgi:TRAP-type mannitol/chloroaromatic compound transport system permease small subunit